MISNNINTDIRILPYYIYKDCIFYINKDKINFSNLINLENILKNITLYNNFNAIKTKISSFKYDLSDFLKNDNLDDNDNNLIYYAKKLDFNLSLKLEFINNEIKKQLNILQNKCDCNHSYLVHDPQHGSDYFEYCKYCGKIKKD